MKSPSLSGVPCSRRADLDDRLAEQAQRSDRRARLVGDARLVLLVHFERDLHFRAREVDAGDLADVDARDPDDRAGLEPLDVGNFVLSS